MKVFFTILLVLILNFGFSQNVSLYKQFNGRFDFTFIGNTMNTARNNTPFGLSAGVWTDKGSKIFNMTTKLKAGVVWANTFNKFDPTSPFGGYKESGYGREGGLHGLAPYLNLV